jgi:hypothetical protein
VGRVESSKVDTKDLHPVKTTNVLAWACGFLVTAAFSLDTEERLTIAVSPLQSFAPTNLTVRVHLTPNDDNGALEISADSGESYRSRRIQLDGRDATKLTTSGYANCSKWMLESRTCNVRRSAATAFIIGCGPQMNISRSRTSGTRRVSIRLSIRPRSCTSLAFSAD